MSILIGAAAGASARQGSASLQAPSQAAAAGFTQLVFQEEFDDTTGIDMADSRQAGFNFYRFTPFGAGVVIAAEDIRC